MFLLDWESRDHIFSLCTILTSRVDVDFGVGITVGDNSEKEYAYLKEKDGENWTTM